MSKLSKGVLCNLGCHDLWYNFWGDLIL